MSVRHIGVTGYDIIKYEIYYARLDPSLVSQTAPTESDRSATKRAKNNSFPGPCHSPSNSTSRIVRSSSVGYQIQLRTINACSDEEPSKVPHAAEARCIFNNYGGTAVVLPANIQS